MQSYLHFVAYYGMDPRVGQSLDGPSFRGDRQLSNVLSFQMDAQDAIPTYLRVTSLEWQWP